MDEPEDRLSSVSLSDEDEDIQICEEINEENIADPHIESNMAKIRSRFEQKFSWNKINDNVRVFGVGNPEDFQGFAPKWKPKLQEAWKKSVAADNDDFDELYLPFQQEILGPLSHYHDISVMNVAHENEEEYRRLMILHAMNYVMKIRDRILHHNQISAAAAANGTPLQDDDLMRDQGFTRPRVLILAPMRNMAYEIVQSMMEFWTSTIGTVDNRKRFEEEYGEPLDSDGEPLDQEANDPTKPADHQKVFRGNVDDCFRFGIKFTRKSMKLFSDFYSSDIIISSPLGLRLVIDGQKEKVPKSASNHKAKRARKADADFLSSIDILMIDRADILHMQNWEHLIHVMEHVNAVPSDPHGCDFSRVQSVYLDGLSRKIRQTLTLSQFEFPELNALLGNPELVDNSLGRWRFSQEHSSTIIKKAKKWINPQFFRVHAGSVTSQSEDRLTYFTNEILPKYSKLDHICIFVSSYFDYCQLKEWFHSSELYSFACLSEYEEGGAITGARSKFFNGHAKFLLVTERFHFYRRLKLRGIKHLIWYSLPDHPEYFKELAEFVGDIHKKTEETSETSRAPKTDSPILYTQFDVMKLERIVGTEMIDKLFQ